MAGAPLPMTNSTLRVSSERTILEITNLTVHYESRPALVDVSLNVERGETVSLLGPNGAGKSTLLQVIAGMLPASHGTVMFNGAIVRGTNAAITYIPQRAGADWSFPISVLEAVQLGLSRKTPRWRAFNRSEHDRAMAALHQIGMDDLADVPIGELSGGQQQRVFLARALLDPSSMLLLDEPFTGVDVPTQELLVSLFSELRTRGTAIIYATHDLAQASRTSDRVVLLNRRVVAAGPPRDVMREEPLRETFGGQVIVLTVPGNIATAATARAAAPR